MTLLRQYRAAAFALIVLSIVAFSIAQVDFAMLFVGVVLATLSWSVTEGPRGRALPDWASNTLVVLLVGWTAMAFLSLEDTTDAMGQLGRFLLWLLVIKLFSRRTPDDDRLRFTLATLLILAGCVDSVEFVFGVLVVLFVVLAVWTAMLRRLVVGAEGARAVRAASEGFAPPLELAVGRRSVPQFRGLLTGSAIAVLAASAGVFVLFPRFATRMGSGPRAGQAMAGFSDEIKLGDSTRISENRRELFTVRWRGADGVPGRSLRPLLLRGAVLEEYDATAERWRSTRRGTGIRTLRTPADGRAVPLARVEVPAGRGAGSVEVEMRSLATDVLFAVNVPYSIATPESRLVSVDPATLLLRDVSTDRVDRYWTYTLTVQQQPDAALLEAMSDGQEPAPAEARFPVAEIEPLAREILALLRTSTNLPAEPAADAGAQERWTYNREVARALADWMKTNFTYTTDLSMNARIVGEDPIESFLSRYRSGHCEYFASALCAMLRSLGIESRVVTGFIAIEFDEQAAHYIVRESNAHAWTEVRTGEFGWTTVDATPEDTLLRLADENSSFLDRFRWIYGRLEFLWNSRVVAYDSGTQATIADGMQSRWRESLGERLSALLERVRAFGQSFSLGGRAIGFWFGVVAIGFGAAMLAATIVRVRRQRLRRALQLDRLSAPERRRVMRDAEFYADALRILDSAGLGKPEHATPLAHAQELAQRDRALGEAFAAIADAYYRVRYGGHAPSRTEADSHHSLVLALRGRLGQSRPSLRAE